MRPTFRGFCVLLVGITIVTGFAGCGKRGAPLPPLRPQPAAVGTLSARRIGDRVELRFTVPSENLDRSSPPAVVRVDIYAAVGPTSGIPPVPAMIPVAAISIAVPSAPIPVSRFTAVRLSAPPPASGRGGRVPPGPPVTAGAIYDPKYLHGHVDVRPPAQPNAKGGTPPDSSRRPPDARPAPGDRATYVDQVDKELAAAAQSHEPVSKRYVVVPVGARNQPGGRSLVEIPLVADPAPVQDAAASYDEASIKLTWKPGATGQKFQVYRSDPAGKEEDAPLNATALLTAAFSTPVEFGVERCFVIRAAVVTGTASIASVESAPVGPVCTTPVDTFPPQPPADLSLLQSEGKITVQWSPVAAVDLAGYIVLRSEGPTPDFQPLMQTPITETNYTDATTKLGVRYTYAVIAVDKAGNRSAPSATAEGVGR
jgi:hypothetical protein